MFQTFMLRAIPDRAGIQLQGRGFDTLMDQNRAKVGERGPTFADRIMRTFSRLDTMIPFPKHDQRDRGMNFPLSVILAPRELEYVAILPRERVPAVVQMFPNERYQYSERHKCSRVAVVTEVRDIPDGFFSMMANHMVQIRGDAPQVDPGAAGAAAIEAIQHFAMGTPARPPADQRGARRGLNMQGVGAGAGAGAGAGLVQGAVGGIVTPPQSIGVRLDAPSAVDYRQAGTEEVALRRFTWVRNPFYINDTDWAHLLSLGVIALKAIVHKHDTGFVENVTEENFWIVLTPMIEGTIHSVKDRVRELVTSMTGNPYGAVQPIQKNHAQLVIMHDLPRYLMFMRNAFQKMTELEGAESSKMDAEDYLETIVTHVSRFIPRMAEQFRQDRYSITRPFTLQIVETEVRALERGGQINQAQSSAAGKASSEGRRVDIHRAGVSIHDPSTFLEPSGGSGTLQSGLNYNNLPYGENFDPQRNMGATGHGSMAASPQAAALATLLALQTGMPEGGHRGLREDRYGRDRREDRHRNDYDRGQARRGDVRRLEQERWDDRRHSNSRNDSNRGRSRSRDRLDERRGGRETPDGGGRRYQRQRSRSHSRDRGDRARLSDRIRAEEESIDRARPGRLQQEAALIQAGFGEAPRITGKNESMTVMYVCANCSYLDHELRQAIRNMAYKHSMATCTRPGGGMSGRPIDDAIAAQIQANDEILRNAMRNSTNSRVLHAHRLLCEADGNGAGTGSVNFRQDQE